MGDIVRRVASLNTAVASNDADSSKPNVLTIDQAITATQPRRKYLLSHLRLGGTEILRISTPLDAAFSEADMDALMTLLISSRVWGVNLGEFRASDAAWRLFGEGLPRTSIGFAWINERGKDIGACTEVHDWLLGIASYAGRGILRGTHSPLACNRLKRVSWCGNDNERPWFDASNPTVHTAVACKFLFNPRNSLHYARSLNPRPLQPPPKAERTIQ